MLIPPASLLARQLTTRLRPEFTVEVIVPACDDPILGTPACRVSGCVRPLMAGGQCTSHYSRWRHEGYPDLESRPPEMVRSFICNCSGGCGRGRRVMPVGVPLFRGRLWLS
jgi:hypothetical protein